MTWLATLDRWRRQLKAAAWRRAGRVPGAAGHGAARWIAIASAVERAHPDGRYGWDDAGVDERAVEYAWAFERVAALARQVDRVLDAGSVLNYPTVLDAWEHRRFPPVTIVTLAPEDYRRGSPRVQYDYADLRQLPYGDGAFPLVISLSTLEHVGMDNAIYGAASAPRGNAGIELSRAVAELRRVTQPGGTLLASVPFGARSDRGWFRIFDTDDLSPLLAAPGWSQASARYFRARREGWRECTAHDARDAGYNEPPDRPGQRTAPAWVAAAEAVALIELSRA